MNNFQKKIIFSNFLKKNMFFLSEQTIRILKTVALTIFSIKITQNIDFGNEFSTKSTKIHHFAATPLSSNEILYFFIKNQQKTPKNEKTF